MKMEIVFKPKYKMDFLRGYFFLFLFCGIFSFWTFSDPLYDTNITVISIGMIVSLIFLSKNICKEIHFDDERIVLQRYFFKPRYVYYRDILSFEKDTLRHKNGKALSFSMYANKVEANRIILSLIDSGKIVIDNYDKKLLKRVDDITLQAFLISFAATMLFYPVFIFYPIVFDDCLPFELSLEIFTLIFLALIFAISLSILKRRQKRYLKV